MTPEAISRANLETLIEGAHGGSAPALPRVHAGDWQLRDGRYRAALWCVFEDGVQVWQDIEIMATGILPLGLRDTVSMVDLHVTKQDQLKVLEELFVIVSDALGWSNTIPIKRPSDRRTALLWDGIMRTRAQIAKHGETS